MAVPKFFEFFEGFLQTVQDGSLHTAKEVRERIAETMQITAEDRAEMLPSGKQSTFDNRVAWARTYLEGVVSLFYYSRDNDYKELLHAVKYGGNVATGRWLGRMLGEKMREAAYPLPDVIVPVPLHWRRQWKRGYNQAEVIARGISEGLSGDIPVLTDILRRVRYSTSQTRMSVGSKWENVSGSFVLIDNITAAERLSGRHVLLVDDVLTTGATVEACWDALRVIPDVRVSYASIAFVTKPG